VEPGGLQSAVTMSAAVMAAGKGNSRPTVDLALRAPVGDDFGDVRQCRRYMPGRGGDVDPVQHGLSIVTFYS